MNRDAAALGMHLERFDCSEMLDDSGEHVCLRASAIECTAFPTEGSQAIDLC